MKQRLLTNLKSHCALHFALMLLPLAGITACSHVRATKESSVQRNFSAVERSVSNSDAAIENKTYQGVGVVKSINLKQVSIEIAHEDIKDLMPAMTMEFYVKQKSLLANLKRGDRIEFTLENGRGGLKITAITKL